MFIYYLNIFYLYNYLHNFSKFDVIFLLRAISNLSENIKPIIRNGQILDLRFKYSKKYTLFFRDSLLLLPATLRSLATNFYVENKGIFPYKFVNNSNISLTYSGLVPEYKYFDGINKNQYLQYVSDFSSTPLLGGEFKEGD